MKKLVQSTLVVVITTVVVRTCRLLFAWRSGTDMIERAAQGVEPELRY
jgi:hypothetical protein